MTDLPEGARNVKAHVLIGFASYSWVESKTVRTMTEMAYYIGRYCPGVTLTFSWRDGFPVAGCKHCYGETYVDDKIEDARNHFAGEAIRVGATHLYMIDSDMDSNDPLMLAKLLAHRVDIVAPLFVRRTAPYEVLAMRYIKGENLWKPITVEEQRSRKVVEIDATGFGAVLINVNVLKDMKFPWFVFEAFKGRKLPEDLNFCRKVRRRGFKIYADTALHLDHIGEHRYRVEEGTALQEMREEIESSGSESSSDSEVSDEGDCNSQPELASNRS